ncbi:MAG: efflux RND transporter periplasmic adaptor subunit [Chitinophagales bacterium]|nr:efflux RND transporter periplasmic adaptor subunit [Chitinophagales bacterium]
MKVYYIALISISMLLLASCKKEADKDLAANGKKPAMGEQRAMRVDGVIAKSEMISGDISTTGTLISDEEVEIKSEVAGRITNIYFKEGQYINKGQLMVRLNDDDLQAEMQKIKIEIKLAEDKEHRQKQLLDAAAVSKDDYEVILTNLQLLKANAEILKTKIDKTKIIAPFSGIVGLKEVSPGAFINNGTIITTLQSIKPLKLEFAIPEKYSPFVQNNSEVSFKVVQSDELYKAKVYARDPKIDMTTRTVKVRALYPNTSGKLSPGSFTDITVSVGGQQKGIMIPSMAYIPDINGARVFIAKNGKAMSVPVKSGLRTERAVQITEGISEGDTILTTGILQLKPQTPINVVVKSLTD